MTSRVDRFIDRPTGSLASLLADPPAAFGPVPIWWWSGDRLDPARLRWQLERLVEGGVRQAVVLNLAPSGPLYGALADEPELFTDEWWAVLLGVCRDADELGFRLWFYDQLGFSGADFQGRLIAREPAYRGWSLQRGEQAHCPDDAVVLSRGEHSLVYAVPRGFDYLSRPAAAALINSVHGEFERRLGPHLGTTVVGSFQDELASMPTWSTDFAAEFRARRGYDLLPVIAALWDDVDTETDTAAAGQQVRADYQRTRAELAEEAFFRPLHDWHEQRGLAVGCDQQHPARAGYPLEATQQYADYLRTHRWFSAPGSDHWGEAKVHSSLAHLYQRPRTWVEAFHTTGWGGTLAETYDWLLPWLRAGATLYNPHAVYYSTRGARWEWAPPSTCWRQPYWHHYPLFAETVTRLCAALSWGEHACDVGVLFPTMTVAADLRLDQPEVLLGSPAGTSAAQDVYLDVVGRMHWFEPRPGALDRDRRDFDVLDDDSVVRASVVDGALRIGVESYRAVVLPGCRLLEPTTAEALAAFARAGGVVVAVGAMPTALSGAGIRHAADAASLAEALADVPRRVDAPLPTLLRSDGDSALLLVTGAHPSATVADRGWREHGYDFDPVRYLSSVEVTVAGVAHPVARCDPGTGRVSELTGRRDGDVMTVDVPLDHGPAALVVFGPAAAAALAAEGGSGGMAQPPAADGDDAPLVVALSESGWTAELLPTMDNRWGDFAGPAIPGPVPVQIWRMEQLDEHGEWTAVRATYGPVGTLAGPSPAAQLDGEPEQWRPVICSDVYGAPPETVSTGTGPSEPRGYVNEEFLDAGGVAAGEAARVRLSVLCAAAASGVLTVGTTADAQVWWNGAAVTMAGGPYYASAAVEVLAGHNALELQLAAPTPRRLRASWTLRSAPDAAPRPQWLAADGAATVLRRTLVLPTAPAGGVLQLGTAGRVTLIVNGDVVARHGESDNYSHVRQPRVRRYPVTGLLVAGANELELTLHEDSSAAVVDALLHVGDEEQWLVTDDTWTASRDGVAGVAVGVAEVPHDPRWVQLRPRPHPLARGHELEGADPDALRIGRPCAPGDGGGAGQRTFRFRLPPGAVTVRLPVAGAVAVEMDGREAAVVAGSCRLDPPDAAGTLCTVTVTPAAGPGPDGGALWTGPVEVQVSGAATMPLGDWSAFGLADYSGGVRYRHVVRGLDGPATLDLGAVRGTAEVRVDGRAVGARLWSPYRFSLPHLDPAGSTLEVDVYGTLGPYQAAVSPTPWVLPGQCVTGLLGPVTLRTVSDTSAVTSQLRT